MIRLESKLNTILTSHLNWKLTCVFISRSIPSNASYHVCSDVVPVSYSTAVNKRLLTWAVCSIDSRQLYCGVVQCTVSIFLKVRRTKRKGRFLNICQQKIIISSIHVAQCLHSYNRAKTCRFKIIINVFGFLCARANSKEIGRTISSFSFPKIAYVLIFTAASKVNYELSRKNQPRYIYR